MRSIGTHRGNPVLRGMIDQSARRRLYSSLEPARAGAEGTPGDPSAVRWTRAFFERLRDVLVPRMAVTAALEDGELRYFGGSPPDLWALCAPHALVLAYEHADSPQQIRERARRWSACLRTRTAPGLASPHWGHPVYGARLDPANGELDVVWAAPGDWVAFAQDDGAAPRRFDSPRHWTALE